MNKEVVEFKKMFSGMFATAAHSKKIATDVIGQRVCMGMAEACQNGKFAYELPIIVLDSQEDSENSAYGMIIEGLMDLGFRVAVRNGSTWIEW